MPGTTASPHPNLPPDQPDRSAAILPIPRRVHDSDVKSHVRHATKLIVIGKLTHFIRGGQLTAGGVMQAVTSVAQTLDDADAASDLEAQALRVMELAAQH